jgi:hypothetical protein
MGTSFAAEKGDDHFAGIELEDDEVGLPAGESGGKNGVEGISLNY